MTKSHLFRSAIGVALMTLWIVASAFAVEFPAREKEKYKSVPYIEIDTLYEDFKANQVVIVDVRSDLEFNTIHVDGSVHIPISSGDFDNEVKRLAQENSGKKIAFYCNGTTCLKSYEAQLKSEAVGVQNTYAFDLGIPGWAELYPEHTILLGALMTESKVKWIPKADFESKCLSWEAFLEKSKEKESMVIDARDNVQKGIFNEKEIETLSETAKANLKAFDTKNSEMIAALKANGRVIEQPFDKMIDNIIKKGKMKDQTLLIFDQVGKQVRWLMYQLEANGYQNYHFLSKGAQGVIGIQAYRQ